MLGFPRLGRVTAVVLAAAIVLPAVARADCNEDLGALMKRRVALQGALEANKKAHGGKLDPVAACPQMRSLAAAQGEVLAYMTKNKEWCGLPDDLLSKMAAAKANIAKFSVQACSVAVKMKQMKEQQAKAPAVPEQQALRLPSGPL